MEDEDVYEFTIEDVNDDDDSDISVDDEELEELANEARLHSQNSSTNTRSGRRPIVRSNTIQVPLSTLTRLLGIRSDIQIDEEEDEARRNESAEIVVHDDTADFLSDSYSEMEEVPVDDEENGEGKEEDYEEGEEEFDDEDENAKLAQTKTASPASVPLPATSSIQDTTPPALS